MSLDVTNADVSSVGEPFVPPVSSCMPDVNVLDWEMDLTIPPPRPSGTIRVRLEECGRSQPTPVVDPRKEKARKE